MFIMFIAFWAVLFTGRYPDSMHGFVVGTIRWQYRVSLYLLFMTDEISAFHWKRTIEFFLINRKLWQN